MLTIFLGTYNRLETLARTIQSFRRFALATPYEVVIVDNGTDNPKCLALLEQIAKRPEVRKVYRLPTVEGMPELTDNFNHAIRDQYRQNKSPWFAVTDADICFEGTSTKALNQYIRLAQRTGFAVGPHLRIDSGIPHGYPFRSRVLATESRLLYASSMDWYNRIPYSAWPIDTTFHVFPRTYEFRRLKMHTLRCGPPYTAMHLDWYVDVFAPTEENWIYINDQRGTVGSWGRGWLRGFWWRYMEDPERAFAFMLKDRRSEFDLCNTAFILSWCLQHGLPEPLRDEARSREWLDGAIPADTIWMDHRDDWLRMIYADDFSALGW